MLSRRRQQGGFTIIGVLIALAIVGILSQQYLSTDTPEGKMWVQSRMDKARSAVTLANTRQVQTQYAMWRMDGRLSTKDIAERFDSMSSSYGSGGRFFVGRNEQVYITTQMETERFSERYELPNVR